MGRKQAVALAVGVLAASCVYTFNNPVATQSAGTISGTLQLKGAVAGQTLAGTQVDMLWSGLSISLGASGNFNFLDLPDGTYTLRYTVPPATPGGAPLVGELRDVYLPFTSGGAADSIALGLISVSAAGSVSGTVTLSNGQPGSGVAVGAFAPTDGGVGEYEGYSTSADSTGAYTLALPAGNHTLWISAGGESASLEIASLQPGENRTGLNLSTTAPVKPGAVLTGYVVVGSQGAHASPSAVEPLLTDPLGLLLNPPCPDCQINLSFDNPDPSQGATAAQVTVTGLTPGVLYDMTCSLASANPPIPALVLHGIPAIAGQATTLQQIFLFNVATLAANQAIAPPDAGTSGWTLLGQAANPASANGASADTVLPLPLPGGVHSLIVSYGTLGLYSAVDDGGGQFSSPAPISDAGLGGDVSPGTLTGTSLGEGAQSLIAWGSPSVAGGNVAVAARQVDGGPWTLLPTDSLSPLLQSDAGTQVVATAYDTASGTPWLAVVTSTPGVQLAPLIAAQTSTDLSYQSSFTAQGLAAAACTNAADGGSAICVLAYGSDSSGSDTAWLTIFDPGTLAYSSAQLPGLETIGGVALVTVGGGQVVPYLTAGPTGATPPGLIPWRDGALVVAEDPSGQFEDVASLGSSPAPPLPPDAGIAPYVPHGYADSSGAALLGLVADGGSVLNLYHLSP